MALCYWSPMSTLDIQKDAVQDIFLLFFVFFCCPFFFFLSSTCTWNPETIKCLLFLCRANHKKYKDHKHTGSYALCSFSYFHYANCGQPSGLARRAPSGSLDIRTQSPDAIYTSRRSDLFQSWRENRLAKSQCGDFGTHSYHITQRHTRKRPVRL